MKISNHINSSEFDRHLFFVDLTDHDQIIKGAKLSKWNPIECEFGPPDNKDGVFYCRNIDDDGFEWHFVNRNNEAMLFRLMYIL